MKRPSVFVGGPEHGALHEADWVVQYLDPVLVRKQGFFSRGGTEIEHRRGTYSRRQYWFFGRLVTVMVDDKLMPGDRELDWLLADALLNDKAKSASREEGES